MFNFPELQISERATPIAYDHLTKTPGNLRGVVLDVAYAGEENAEWLEASLTNAGPRNRQKELARIAQEARQRGEEPDPTILARHRREELDEDRALFARCIVKGWKGGIADQARFTEEACRKHLAALPDWLFRRLLNFCSNPENFVGARVDPATVEAIAGS